MRLISTGGNNMATYHMQRIRFCLLLVALAALTSADKSTIERIRKHQEWLRQRQQQQQKLYTPPPTLYKKSFELANLWRFGEKPTATAQNTDPRINDVFPENEALTTTTTKTPITSTVEQINATTAGLDSISTSAPLTIETAKSITILQPTTEATTTASTIALPTLESTHSISNVTMPAIINSTISTPPPVTTTTSTVAKIRKPKQHPYPRWGNWSKLSACSRSCGGGVKHQQRKCISR